MIEKINEKKWKNASSKMKAELERINHRHPESHSGIQWRDYIMNKVTCRFCGKTEVTEEDETYRCSQCGAFQEVD